MSLASKKKKRKVAESFDINVTPMVDMFSVLISFLLVAAVFSATGQARVDVPFLSSRPPPDEKEKDKNPPVNLTLVISAEKANLEVTGGTIGEKPQSFEYMIVESGLDELQAKIYDYRKADLRVDTITFMTDDDIPYETLVQVLDAVRVLKPSRPPLDLPVDYNPPRGVEREALIPKIVMGNVIL
jgi:biopolymer transport protein ExbD